MALTTAEVAICNHALDKIGSTNFTVANQATANEGIKSERIYTQTRDALLRSYSWRFARARAVLVKDTTDPAFEWDNQFILPNNFLRFRSIYEEDGATSKSRRRAFEGQRLLTNLDTVSLRYIKKVTDTTEFDPLFIELLIWLLADTLVTSLAGGDKRIQDKIDRAIPKLERKAMAVNEDETDVGGRSDWVLARHGGAGIASQEERFW